MHGFSLDFCVGVENKYDWSPTMARRQRSLKVLPRSWLFEIQLKFFDVYWMWCGEALRALYSPGESIAHRAVARRLTMAATQPIVQSEWIKAQTDDCGYTRTCIMSFHLGRADQPSVTNCNCSLCNAQRERVRENATLQGSEQRSTAQNLLHCKHS